MHKMKDGYFKNPYSRHSQGKLFSFLRKRFCSEHWGKGDPSEIPFQMVDVNKIKQPDQSRLQTTWLGHSSVLVQHQGISVLTDPVFSDYASPIKYLGPKRYTKLPFKEGDLPKIDYILISHNHYDHLDKKTVKYFSNQVSWLVPLGLKKWFTKQGVSNVVELDWWQEHRGKNINFTSTPTQHWSKRSPWDAYSSLWCSWCIEIADKKFFFGGDTGYNPFQFKEIGDRLGPFDLAALPIGAYEPRGFMRSSHINPAEAISIHHEVKSRLSFGIHWGTFLLSQEPLLAPKQELELLSQQNKLANPFITISIGKTLIAPEELQKTQEVSDV